MEMKYKVEFYSDWHCGSGLSSGSDIDSLVIKDEDGLPFVPGKTLKGLLREAAEQICGFRKGNKANDDFIVKCFGRETDKKTEDSDAGCCYFSNAELDQKTKEFFNSAAERKSMLFRKISSTAIDEKGMASEHSLRRAEVTVPVSLHASIAGIPEEFAGKIRLAMKWVKRLGENRNRGL
ncbi:MAG: RAMP superfamily CRISPR-associated protein, partial [Lentisphaerota bacterium]